MKLYSLPTAVLALITASPAHALTFPIVGRSRSQPHRLGRRAVDMNGSYGNGSTSVSNSGDTEYSCNITLGGAEFEVLIDTGRCAPFPIVFSKELLLRTWASCSSDLWVSGTVPNTKDLKIAASVSYAEGSASGSINTAELIFDEFTIKDQAYSTCITFTIMCTTAPKLSFLQSKLYLQRTILSRLVSLDWVLAKHRMCMRP